MAERQAVTAFVGLGSNLGNRQASIRAALVRLGRVPGVTSVRRSRLYETAPVHVHDQPWFVNAVAEIQTGLTPAELLAAFKQIERELGRQPTRRWGERVVDLDLLLYGDQVVQTDQLTVPHARLWERLFVVLPLAELAPDLRAPDGRSIGEVAAELSRDQVVRPFNLAG
jgi:2-amino-4-hydroxy-6-hydroxymethyldihydropteridine diphosphokinase